MSERASTGHAIIYSTQTDKPQNQNRKEKYEGWEPRSSPVGFRSKGGTRSSPTRSWIGWFTTRIESNSKASRCANTAGRLLRSRLLRIHDSDDQWRAYSRGRGESVTRSDRRRRELGLESPSPPLACPRESTARLPLWRVQRTVALPGLR